jgi:DNA transformation protein
MPSDPSFVAHVLDLFAPMGDVTARAMFGGHGVYAEGVMFALLDDDELFLKTDEATRAAFLEAGCRQWIYVNKKVRMENTGYYRPPDEAHEDPEVMRPWARLALGAALRARAAKAAKAAKGTRRRPAARAKASARRSAPSAKTRRAPRAARGKKR